MSESTTVPSSRISHRMKTWFPAEIILEILDYVPQIDIMFFHDRLPENDPLQHFLVQRMYKRVLVKLEDENKHFWLSENEMCYIVDQEAEMRRIVQQYFPIQRLEYCGRGLLDPWFIDVVADNPDYFSRIPSVVYNGSIEILSEFASVCLVDNFVSLIIEEPTWPEHLPHFSSKLKHTTIGGYHKSMFKHTQNLKSLELFYCDLLQDTHPVVLPSTIEELKCTNSEGEHIWRNGSPALKKLSLISRDINLKDFQFPEGLVELTIGEIDLNKFSGEDIKFPSTLKKLILRVRSLGYPRSIEFPVGLECLSFGHLSLESSGSYYLASSFERT